VSGDQADLSARIKQKATCAGRDASVARRDLNSINSHENLLAAAVGPLACINAGRETVSWLRPQSRSPRSPQNPHNWALAGPRGRCEGRGEVAAVAGAAHHGQIELPRVPQRTSVLRCGRIRQSARRLRLSPLRWYACGSRRRTHETSVSGPRMKVLKIPIEVLQHPVLVPSPQGPASHTNRTRPFR